MIINIKRLRNIQYSEITVKFGLKILQKLRLFVLLKVGVT